MDFKSKFATAAITLMCFTLLATTAGADQWAPNLPNTAGDVGVTIQNSFENSGDAASYITVPTGSLLPNGQPGYTGCSSAQSSGPCDPANTSKWNGSQVVSSASVLFPVCQSADETNCIAGMSIGNSLNSLTPSTFVRMTDGPTLAADASIGLPQGSTVGLWTNPFLNSGQADTYATYAMADLSYSGGEFHFRDFTAMVIPYVERAGQYSSVTVNTGNGYAGVSYVPSTCAWVELGECGVIQDLSSGESASLSVRLSDQIGGWFQGRISSPTLSVTPFDKNSNLIVISGASVQVPELAVNVPSSNPILQSIFSPVGGVPVSSTSYQSFGVGLVDDFQAVDGLRAVANDTASGVVSIWQYSTFNQNASNNCMSNTSNVLGLVTTNSMVFQGSPPTFSNGYLSYQVAGMHYLPDGSLALGTYDMIIADSVARCLYGYSSAPISASVSVTEGSGVDNVATTSVTDVGGWLRLSADGFTFSDPTISVKLTQAAAKSKTTTITCVKGTNVKRVTGVSPRCPAGYRARTTITCAKGTSVKRVTGVSPRCPVGYKRKS